VTTTRPHWLLDLDLEGRTIRYADAEVRVTTQSGEVLVYLGGLGSVTVEDTGEEGGPQTAAIEIVDPAEDWPRTVARGAWLDTATGSLALWYEGDTWERRRRILRGRLVAPSYGPQVLSASLERLPWVDQSVIPDAAATICDATWPVQAGFSLDESVEGATYPVVVGCPGVGDDGSPAPMAEYSEAAATWISSRLLVAAHEVAAATVTVHDASDDVSGLCTLDTVADGRGRRVTVVDFSDPATGAVLNPVGPHLGHDYWIRWTVSGGGGMLHRGSAPRGAGAVLAMLMGWAYGGDVDPGRADAQRTWLDGFLLDFYVNDRVALYNWILSNVAPILPIRYVDGEAGAYWSAWRYDARATDATWALERGRNVERVGDVEPSDDDVFNDFELSYCFVAGSATKKVHLSATPTTTPNQSPGPAGTSEYYSIADWLFGVVAYDGDADLLASYLCRWSQLRYGVRPWVGSTRIVADDATAMAVLRALADRYAWGRRRIRYVGGHAELGRVEVGDVVTVTDDELYLSGAPALVRGVGIDLVEVQLTVEVLDRPGETTRRTT
jgi:hypothetical protein